MNNAVNWSEYLSYEPETGNLLWKVKRPGPKTFIGMEAGSVNHNRRYRSFVLLQKRHYTHRVIWEMVHGPIPVGMCIDHIDGNGLNNRIENLRVTTLSSNQRNRRRTKTNTTGIDGVSRHSRGFSIYCASKYVKHTSDFFEACCIRKSAEIANGYYMNQGRTSA